MLGRMEMHFTPHVQAELEHLTAVTGCSSETLANDILATHFSKRAEVRKTLNRRYDDLESGRVQSLDGEAVFERLIAKYTPSVTSPE
jgi:hypothetical protein